MMSFFHMFLQNPFHVRDTFGAGQAGNDRILRRGGASRRAIPLAEIARDTGIAFPPCFGDFVEGSAVATR
jgi:hypothetical protein